MKVQVITGLHGCRGVLFSLRTDGLFLRGAPAAPRFFRAVSGETGEFRNLLLQNPAASRIISKCVICGFSKSLHLTIRED